MRNLLVLAVAAVFVAGCAEKPAVDRKKPVAPESSSQTPSGDTVAVAAGRSISMAQFDEETS
ncbi:MAG: hypothetical protein WC889_18070, partial [Myxococcota bacterium]